MKKMSSEYESQGLTANAVEGLNAKAVELELKRERAMNQSLQRDVEMLRKQLETAEKLRATQASQIAEAEGKLADQQDKFQ